MRILSLLAGALMLSACTNPPLPAPTAVGLANPASVFCVQQGGRSQPITTPTGTSALCMLPDGRAIEEWAFYRQHGTPPVR